MEMVITFTHDLSDLKVCSLTCRSWYTATVPHLHHTLTLVRRWSNMTCSRLELLSKLHKLGSIPLVRVIWVDQWPVAGLWFMPLAFNCLSLHSFSTLTNVHTLKFDTWKSTTSYQALSTISDTSCKHCDPSCCTGQAVVLNSSSLSFQTWTTLGSRILKHSNPSQAHRAHLILYPETTRAAGALQLY